MSDIDFTKEQVSYLKLLLGILIATELSLLGWVTSNIVSTNAIVPVFLILGCAFVAIVIAVVCFALHKKIEAKIHSLKEM